MMDTTKVVPNILGSIQNITKDKGVRNNKELCDRCLKWRSKGVKIDDGRFWCENCYKGQMAAKFIKEHKHEYSGYAR